MTPTSPSAFLLSATLHGLVIALMLMFNYAMKLGEKEPPRILELVAGAGDDYMAKEAPALGVEGGIKVPLAQQQPEPRPKPQPPTPPVAPPPEVPPTKATPPPPTKAAEPPPPDFQKKLKQDIRTADNKAKREIVKERAAEKKRQDEEKKRQDEEEKKRMTKEQFDRQNRTTKTVASATSKALPVKKIDVDGIAGGVVGGSSASKKGAGGKALKSDNEDVLAAYYGLFKQELRKKFEPPPGLSDSLKVEIEVRSNLDGSMANARIAKSSGSKEFDNSVLEAIRRVKMPARPDRKSETIQFVFSMLDQSDR